jgi:nicotinamidase-related amidase
MDTLGIIDRNKSVFVLIDVQEKFIPVIGNIEQVILNANILVKVSEILKTPLIVTEQYPKGLGETSKKIVLPPNVHPIEKMEFSCFNHEEFVKKINSLKVDSIVLFGIEAHVCILQTALDALKNDLNVYVVSDAISSRTLENKKTAIERMRQSGVFVVSTEILLFQLLKKAGTEEFRQISKLIK